jgi:hypothetical protein
VTEARPATGAPSWWPLQWWPLAGPPAQDTVVILGAALAVALMVAIGVMVAAALDRGEVTHSQQRDLTAADGEVVTVRVTHPGRHAECPLCRPARTARAPRW